MSKNESTSSTTRSSLETDLIRDEGWVSKPYKDTKGILTVGVGHNLEAEGLCEEAILAQLRFDIRTKAMPLYKKLPWLSSKPEKTQRALLNMAFNLGIEGLLKFAPTLELIRLDQPQQAVARIKQTPYYRQVGKRAERVCALLLGLDVV